MKKKTCSTMLVGITILTFSSGVLAQSSCNWLIKKISNDSLLVAYKQSINDVSFGRYVDASFGMLKGLGVKSIDQIDDVDVVDQWAQVMSTMTGLPNFNKAKGTDYHVPENQLSDLGKAKAISAIDEIVRLAHKTRVVILNENHLDPRGRAFGLEVAKALKPLGYNVIAAEAFKAYADDEEEQRKMKILEKDGVVRGGSEAYSGYYLDDPVFAEFIRQSLEMGYRPVSYETAGRGYTNQEREEVQADQLIRRGLMAYPNSKLLVYVGERHAAENPILGEENPYLKMAAILKKKTGIDPLTIDQAALSPLPMNRPDSNLYEVAAPKAINRSVVLYKKSKSLIVGLLAGAVDLQVVHPISNLQNGRPDWMYKMNRSPVTIPEYLLPKSEIRLIQAFVESAPVDARPLDQVLVESGKTPPVLLLPNIKIRYAIQEVK